MKKLVSIVGLSIILLTNTKLVGQERQEKLDEVVVTATKFKLKKENTGKVIYKITAKEIEENAGKSLIELLNNLPGIEIRGTQSNFSEPRSISVRGGRSRHVVILIDGVPVSDATGVNQAYDLRLLSLNQIERIEVLKGASSTLYGSGASTGVINIILKKASKNKVSGSYEVSVGTNTTSQAKSLKANDFNQNASVNGTLGKINYLAYYNLTGTKGFSAARSTSEATFENDGFYSENGVFKLGFQPRENIKIDAFLNYDTFTYDYDLGAAKDTPINHGKNKQIRYGIKSSYSYEKGEVYLLATFNQLARTLHGLNTFTNAVNIFDYESSSVNLDLVNRFVFSDEIQLITGLNYQKHENQTQTDFETIDKQIANFNTIDPYVSVVYASAVGLNINLGGRLNIHSTYGNHFVYDANVSYHLLQDEVKRLKLLTSYSTAFIAPSLYQLYSAYGSLDILPEESSTIEFGFEGSYKTIVNINAVFFKRNIKNEILFNSLSQAPWGIYQNGTENNEVEGIETNLSVNPLRSIKIDVGYTYINKDNDTDYIPRNKLVASVSGNPFKNTFMSVVFKNVGERTFFDQYGSFGTANENVILPSYTLLDFNVNHRLLEDTVTFFATVSNILNEDYQETLGYNTRGRNYKLGVRLQF